MPGSKSVPFSRSSAGIYTLTVFMLALTGFAQMPIFKRYYIADLPGLGWLAKYYITHNLHYLGAIVFLGLLAYLAVEYLLHQQATRHLTPSGYFRAAVILGIVVTGVLRVIKNFPGYYFSSGAIVFLDFLHLALVMLLLAGALYGLIFKKDWTISRP
jgi:hypothetical protein